MSAINRRWVWAALGLIALVWAGAGGYGLYWQFYGEWDRAEKLAARAQAGESLSDREFAWAVARLDHPHAAVARHSREAATGGWAGDPARAARLEASATPLLDAPDPGTRLRGLDALWPLALGRPTADPVRQRLRTVALALLDDPHPYFRGMGAQVVGFVGTPDDLPRVRPLVGSADPLEAMTAAAAVQRLKGVPDGPP